MSCSRSRFTQIYITIGKKRLSQLLTLSKLSWKCIDNKAILHGHITNLRTSPRDTLKSSPSAPNTPIPLALPQLSIHTSSGSISLFAIVNWLYTRSPTCKTKSQYVCTVIIQCKQSKIFIKVGSKSVLISGYLHIRPVPLGSSLKCKVRKRCLLTSSHVHFKDISRLGSHNADHTFTLGWYILEEIRT